MHPRVRVYREEAKHFPQRVASSVRRDVSLPEVNRKRIRMALFSFAEAGSFLWNAVTMKTRPGVFANTLPLAIDSHRSQSNTQGITAVRRAPPLSPTPIHLLY